MWDAIRRNTRRSRLVIVAMALMLVVLGGLIGATLGGAGGVYWGVTFSVGIWLLLLAVTLLGGEGVILYTSGAKEIEKVDAPQLWNVVEEMTIAAGLPKMPRVFVQSGYMLNAFAVGRTTDTACVVVTDGLVRKLSRDELQGVVAHEVGHIRNLDVRFMTIAAVMLGSITMMAESCRRILWFGGGGRTRSRAGGQAKLLLLALLLVAAILAPLTARLLYLACSRQREYLADASAARFTRFPEGLASALEKIGRRAGVTDRDKAGALAPMYIVNPARQENSETGWFRTHPPTSERVRILRSMGGNAGWADYERAYRKVAGRDALLASDLTGEPTLRAREATADPEPESDAIGRLQEVVDALDRSSGLLLIPCACGVRIKVPEGFGKERIHCMRCGAAHEIPHAGAANEVADADLTRSLTFRREGPGWSSFRCGCGKVLHASPALEVSTMKCGRCGRRIEVA